MSGTVTTFEPTDWEARLKAAVDKIMRERARKAEERAEFARRRAYGLIQRHARKEAHLRRTQGE